MSERRSAFAGWESSFLLNKTFISSAAGAQNVICFPSQPMPILIINYVHLRETEHDMTSNPHSTNHLPHESHHLRVDVQPKPPPRSQHLRAQVTSSTPRTPTQTSLDQPKLA